MAQRGSIEGMQAALSLSLERQKQNLPQQSVLLLGKGLEHYMVKLTADIQKTTELIDQGIYTPPVYRAFINNLHDTKMCVVKAFAQWQRGYGSKADPSVGRSVLSLEEATDTLIDRIKHFMTEIPFVASPVPAARINQSIQPKICTPIASRVVVKNPTSKTVENQSKTVKSSDSGVVRARTVSARFKNPHRLILRFSLIPKSKLQNHR